MEINDATFDAWSNKKKILDKRKAPPLLYKEGEIWWAAIGQNVGSETHGKGEDFARPVLILKKLSENACIVIPSTTKPKNGTWFYPIAKQNIRRWFMLHQVRYISTNRLRVRESRLGHAEFSRIKESVLKLMTT